MMFIVIVKWIIAIGLIVGSIVEETVYKKRRQKRKANHQNHTSS